MSTKLGRVLLLCDQALLDMRHLTYKVTTLEQCYVGEGVDDHTGTADLSDTEVALIQQVIYLAMRPSLVLLCTAVMAAGRQISLHMSVTFALCAASPVYVQATSSSFLRVCSNNGSRVQSYSRFPCAAHYLGRADCSSILCLRSFFGIHTLRLVPSFSLSNTPFQSLSIGWSLRLLTIELVSQEVDRIEQQNAQLQFRLDELERDFNASGNRFPSLEKSLRRCIRVLRDMDSDMSSSSSSSSEGWLEPRPIRTHVQTLHVQIKALVRAVNRQNKRLQEFRDNLKSVQAALVKMVKKKQLGQPTGLEGYLPSKDACAGEKLKASK